MAEVLEGSQALESTTVGIYRTASVVKGGRRFSFAALVVVGDRRGSVGIGYGKAPGVPAAIEKAQKDARKQMFKVTLKKGTLPHPVTGKFGSSQIRLLPAAPGTGVIAGGTARAVLEMAGVNDCLTKAYGSTNEKNLCKAVITGLRQLRLPTEVARLRGVDLGKTEVDEKIEAAQKFMAESASEQATAKPQAGGGKADADAKAKPQQQPAANQPQATSPTGAGVATTAPEAPQSDTSAEAQGESQPDADAKPEAEAEGGADESQQQS